MCKGIKVKENGTLLDHDTVLMDFVISQADDEEREAVNPYSTTILE